MELSFYEYITKSVNALAQGKCIERDWADLVNLHKKAEPEKFDPVDVVNKIVSLGGLKLT